MAIWRPLDRFLNPLLQAIRQVPLMGWLPLLGLWVGTGGVRADRGQPLRFLPDLAQQL
jgi:ABC-type nitrate/sulfonate/bicarbonate transport system permease component